MKADFVSASLHAFIRLFILKDVKQENEFSDFVLRQNEHLVTHNSFPKFLFVRNHIA
ncbi:hypothetical protein LEP1GSC193_3615 [Leptospira alstonii serovar Pingchang str. 80-412]|uniref:Uncharacterized protein n=1 Tax=Leptospira alstonii serovar Pingchang str. 80-412 TaxID=1218564 RepID=T0H6J7_9LEPT|nr:hypothetical protein LEP1GSC193_3615 [Leptospira alstonii serovar Pingchang str. 80-412]